MVHHVQSQQLSLVFCIGTTHLSNPTRIEQKIQDPVRLSVSSIDCIKAQEGAFPDLEKPWIF